MNERIEQPLKGYIHSMESFGSVDGPGVRFIIFFAGCAMRCQYCHNPDTWDINNGTLYTAAEIIARAVRYRSYWGKEGGITISGGDPLLQIDFLTELCCLAKANDIHVVLDTSGNLFSREEPQFGKIKRLLQYVDLVLLDIKHIDEKKHLWLTGFTNKNIIDFAKYLDSIKKPVWIRHVLVPNRTDKDEHLKRLKLFIDSLNNIEKVEVLPYHTLGVSKWEELGMEYPLVGVEPPSEQRLENANKILGTNYCEESNI